MLNPGQPAPAFTAESTQGTIKISEVLGTRPIVLIFYPKDETPVCTKQLCAVRDSAAQYAAHDALVIGVNPGSIEEHQQFASKHQLDFPLIADRDGTVRQLYDVGKIFGLFGQQRVVYVIGRDGRIAFAEKGNRPTAEIIAVLESGGASDAN